MSEKDHLVRTFIENLKIKVKNKREKEKDVGNRKISLSARGSVSARGSISARGSQFKHPVRQDSTHIENSNHLQYTQSVFEQSEKKISRRNRKTSYAQQDKDVCTPRSIAMNYQELCYSPRYLDKDNDIRRQEYLENNFALRGDSDDKDTTRLRKSSSSSADSIKETLNSIVKGVPNPLEEDKNTDYYSRPNRDIKRALKNNRRDSV